MKISRLVNELNNIKDSLGDLEVSLQGKPIFTDQLEASANFFVVPEKYDLPDEYMVNLRIWPY